MKVKMTVQTTHGKPLRPGDVVDVPKPIADRWVKNGIAVLIETKLTRTKQEQTTDDQE